MELRDIGDILVIVLLIVALYASKGKPWWQKIVAVLAAGLIFTVLRIFLPSL